LLFVSVCVVLKSCIQCQGLERMELYLHFSICLCHVYRDNFTFTL
jgi:hypothetical protein